MQNTLKNQGTTLRNQGNIGQFREQFYIQGTHSRIRILRRTDSAQNRFWAEPVLRGFSTLKQRRNIYIYIVSNRFCAEPILRRTDSAQNRFCADLVP